MYTIDHDDGVIVFEVQAELDAADFETAFDELVEEVERTGATAVVSHVTTDEPYGVETFREWERAGKEVARLGVRRWAIVAEGTKQLSLRSQVSESELEVSGTEDLADAMSWARG